MKFVFELNNLTNDKVIVYLQQVTSEDIEHAMKLHGINSDDIAVCIRSKDDFDENLEPIS